MRTKCWRMLLAFTLITAGCGGGNGGEATSVPPDETVNADWQRTADEFRGRDGMRVAYNCPASGEPYTVWGDRTYTDDSSVCTAAVHAGLITFEKGGTVVVEIVPGQDSYGASDANGVSTASYGSWGGSFRFTN